MKFVKKICLLCIAISVSLFVGCSPDYSDGGNGDDNSIVGTWENINDLTETYVFNSNGTGVWNYQGSSVNFTYSVSGSTITLTGTINGNVVNWTLTSFDGQTFRDPYNDTFRRRGSNPNPNPNPSGGIVGDWEFIGDNIYRLVVRFKADGTGEFREYQNGILTDIFFFDYIYNSNTGLVSFAVVNNSTGTRTFMPFFRYSGGNTIVEWDYWDEVWGDTWTRVGSRSNNLQKIIDKEFL